MDQAYRFRKGTLADIPSFQRIGVSAYGQYQNVLSEEGWQKMGGSCGDENTYIHLLNNGHAFVCEHEGIVIGMAFLVPHGNPFAFFEADWAYIRLVGVMPEHGGRGVGRKLTQLCVDLARSSGEKTLALHTSEFQNAARHIYESMGFVKLKELERIYEKRYWLYTMSLQHTNDGITYHLATAADIKDLIALRIAFAFDLTGVQDERSTQKVREHLAAYFEETFRLRTSIWYLARKNGEAIGIGGMLIRQNPPNFVVPNGKMGYLVNMYTIPLFRRKGICSGLMKALVKAGEESGIKAFELHATKEGELVYQQQEFKIHHEPTYRRYI